MSERLPSPETHELVTAAPEVQAERPQGAEYGKAEQAEQLERAQAAVAEVANAAERPALAQLEPVDDRPQLIDNVAKMLRMRKSLSHVQNRLKPAEKSFSKVIHQPLIRRVSETTAQNITRPSGLLGGGLVAFIGSLIYLWLTRVANVTYNYFVFLVLFVGGFLLGVGVEWLLFFIRKQR